eukprot:10465603-Lingulodinium_polyedra.AAC.1
MSKLLQPWGVPGPPLSRYVRLTRCSWSGPRPARWGAASASGSAGLPSQEPLPEEPPSTAGAGAG